MFRCPRQVPLRHREGKEWRSETLVDYHYEPAIFLFFRGVGREEVIMGETRPKRIEKLGCLGINEICLQ